MADEQVSHELIQLVKDLALELGRTPTRPEFNARAPGGEYRTKKYFKNYGMLLKAAGLETYHERQHARKDPNALFRRDISQALAEYEAPSIIVQPLYTSTLVIPDTHFPFVSERVLAAIYAWAQKYQPKRIIQIGDLYDMYANAKFPRSLNHYTPNQEEDLGREMAARMWATLQTICPQAECIQLKGNHDVRPLKRTMEMVPALERAVATYLNALMTFPGVKLIEDPRQEYIVEGIEFIHGYRSRLGEHRDYALMNAVCGHQHVGGTVYKRIRGQTLWELNAGLAGDPEAKALSYTPQKITHWTPGFGWIDADGPRFVPV